MADTIYNVNSEKINYLNVYFQNEKDENAFTSFFKVDGDANITKRSNEIKDLLEKVEEAKAQLELEYAKIYSKKYSPISRPNIFEYYTRNGETYYYTINGNQVIGDDINGDNYNIIELNTKHGDISVIDGYCYELSGIIIKSYRYNISTNNHTCTFRLYDEELFPFLDKTQVVYNKRGWVAHRQRRISSLLTRYNAQEFINTLYGINIEFKLNLEEAYECYRDNPAFEIILKTAPASLIIPLLRMKNIEKSEPIYKLLGLNKPLYEEALANNMELQCYELRNHIINKDIFHKTAPEWIEMIKDFILKENDFEFFHISYGANYRYRNYEHCKLLGVLAEAYSKSKIFQKYYSFGKFSNYIVEETINQGFSMVEDFIGKLNDYLRMCDDQGIVPTLYSSYLTQTHDIAARNHKVYLNQEQEKIIAKRYEGYKAIKVGKNKEYQIIAPTSSEDIKKEGDALNHCVASYIKRVLDGETKIFFMRKDPLVSLITLEIRDNRICQARGMHNRKPDHDEAEAIKEFAKKKELEYCNAY